MANNPPKLNPALREFWEAPARNRVLYGGRASSKSWDAAGYAVFLAQLLNLKICCVRQFQNKIEESVYTLLKTQINRFDLSDNFTVLNNKIKCKTTDSEFVFYGLWRSIDEIKSLEGIDILWIEEGHNLTKEQWEVLEPTIRKHGSQVWLIFNPNLATDFAYKNFVVNPPPNTVIRLINYDENPFLSQTMLDIINNCKASNYEDYLHIYRGVPREDDDAVLIKRSHVMAAIDAHIKLDIEIRGSHRLGFDVADSGEDQCASVHMQGSLALWSDMWKAKEDELLKSCSRVWSYAYENNALITYDAIGVGAMCGSKFNEINNDRPDSVRHQKFFAGGSVERPDQTYSYTGVKNKNFFSNIKAQRWWRVAERFRNTYNAVTNGEAHSVEDMLFISSDMPNLDKLIDELTTPRQDYDLAGRQKVESKKDLAKRDVKSPNLADAFVMAEGGFVGTYEFESAGDRSYNALDSGIKYKDKGFGVISNGHTDYRNF